MRQLWLGLMILALAACTSPGAPSVGSVSKTISASSGGTLELGGAKLFIPAGALDKDSTVKLTVGDKPQGVSGDPLTPAGAAVASQTASFSVSN